VSFLKAPPPRVLPGVLEKIKSAYILWHQYHSILPKTQRYSVGNMIDKIFIELIEVTATASFFSKNEKLPYIRVAIRKLDLLKVLLLVIWETKSLDNKKYISLSLPLDEIGRMLGGWYGQTEKYMKEVHNKQNSPA
jgi:hypothetical protein